MAGLVDRRHPADHPARTQRARPAARHRRGHHILDTHLLLPRPAGTAAQEPGTATRHVLGACLSRMPGNWHVRFLGGRGRSNAPRLPDKEAEEDAVLDAGGAAVGLVADVVDLA